MGKGKYQNKDLNKVFTKYGNLKIAKVGIQRKGGDSGGKGAKMLQFKIDPTLLL